MILKFIKNILSLSEDEMARLSRAKELRKKYPSIRVVGRGTIIINPKDIIDSQSFKNDLNRCHNIIIKN